MMEVKETETSKTGRMRLKVFFYSVPSKRDKDGERRSDDLFWCFDTSDRGYRLKVNTSPEVTMNH